MRLAVDVPKTVEIAVGEQGSAAEHHHVCPVHPDYKQLPEMTRNVEEAKKLLADAGYPDGIDIEITCKPDPAWELATVEAMVEQWKDANIRCKINVCRPPSTGTCGTRCRSASPTGCTVRSASWCWALPIAVACRGTSLLLEPRV